MDGYVIIGTEIDTKSFDAQIKEVEAKLNDVESSLQMSEKDKTLFSTSEIRQMKKEAEQLSNKLVDLKKKQADINKTDLSKAQKSMKHLGDATSKTIKKVSKWALGVFAIESAYGFIRRSMGLLSQYNDQIKTDVDYIGFAMATALQPAIERLIMLAYQLLSYINAISQAWFGVDLFANASAEGMRKGAKSAKEMQKALSKAGFDEMNVLTDNKGSGGVSGGGTSPSFDLSKANVDTEKTKNFWKEYIQFWEHDWEEFLGSIGGNWGSFFDGLIFTLKGFYDTMKGFFDAVGGIFKVLVGVIQGDFDKIKEGGKQLGLGLLKMLKGLLEMIFGVLLTAGGLLKGIFLDIVQGVYNFVIKPIANFFKGLWENIVNGVKWAVSGIKNVFYGIVDFFKWVIGTITGFFRNLGIKAGEIIGGAFKMVINAVLGTIERILNSPIRAINSLIKVINKMPGIKLSSLSTFSLPRLKTGGIVNMPNRGVPVGSALAGESGREGVIPLTDSQAMEELGNAIGKYITINANITNSMNGRVISRELQRIQNDNDFAFNR